ncbi:hypothetical protein CRYUN_Cryun12cG0022100 [Craigia yunnanensis]
MLVDTPLHIAASYGQTCFAMEVMNLMLSFARKLNKDGLSPIHLALLKGHSELVPLLLHADRERVRVKRRGGMTPLHYATQSGNIDLLADFLVACPRSIEDMTVESETVLHIAVKNNMLEALEVLVGWFERVCHKHVFSWKTNILNWGDRQGNTALDIAVSSMQLEASVYGNTALDIAVSCMQLEASVYGNTALDIAVSSNPVVSRNKCQEFERANSFRHSARRNQNG